ncbi:MAG: D-2-hydroxyacid dehydrogenase family protein [Burkholderiales bacterium]|nr:D-2-hydroxyacid dehydrogenase family protein [Burkholderiales bacterium]
MKIAVIDDYQDSVRHLECFSLLDGHEVKVFTNSARGIGQLAIRLAPFDVLVLIRERTRITRPLLTKLPNLKLIAQTGKVGPHIDLAAAAERNIVVTEGLGDPVAPAELTWALIMAARRKITQYAAYLKEGLWQTSSLAPQHNALGRRLYGQTLGIWGFGKIGRLVAGYGKAFGMRVVVWGSDTSRAEATRHGYETATSKASFLSECDIVSLHLRLNDANRGHVTAADLGHMKPDSLLVNTSRAELIETGALEAALQSGRPGAAAFDVFESEPLPPQSPLLRMENVLATPHIGFVEKESYELYFRAAFQSIVQFAENAKNR